MIAVIIPLFILVFSVLMRFASGPFWLYADPSYIYLFNALYMVEGHAPIDVSHPGTPVQVLIYAMIRLFNCGRSLARTVDSVFIRPELFLNSSWIILAIAAIVTSCALGVYVYRKTKDTLAVTLVQLPGLIFLSLPSFNSSYPMLPVVANVTPEPLFVSVMNLFTLAVLRNYFDQDRRNELKNTAFLAFVGGLGLATKMNFFPVLFVALLIVEWRSKVLFIIAFAFSFIFWTLPIIPKYPVLWGCVKMMFFHTSRYGRGAEGIIDWNSYFQYFGYMLHDFWFFILTAFALFTGSLICLIKDRKNREIRYLGAVTLGVLLQFAATAKYFSFHYLVPGFGLFSLVFILFYLFLKQRVSSGRLRNSALAFIFIFSAIGVFHAVVYHHRLSEWTRDILGLRERTHDHYPQCTLLATWSSDMHIYLSQEHALYIANGTILYSQSDELFRLYPDFYYFYSEEIGPSDTQQSYGIWDFKQRVFGEDLMNASSCSIFLRSGDDFSRDPYQVRLLDKSKYLHAFLLTGSTEKEANGLFLAAQDYFSKGDLVHAFALAAKSRELNYQPRGQVEYYLAMIYRYLKGNNHP